MATRIKKGDQVLIIKGKDRDKKGKVLRVLGGGQYLVIEAVNMAKRHRKPTQKAPGGIVEKALPLHASKAMLVCPRCSTPTKVKKQTVEKGKRIRVCKRCGEFIDKV